MPEPDSQIDKDVVGRFIKDGRLVIMPSKRGQAAARARPHRPGLRAGRSYQEPEVNEVLERYHDDYAALRRYLVDEGFLSREGGVYWRTGGTVEV